MKITKLSLNESSESTRRPKTSTSRITSAVVTQGTELNLTL